MTNSVVVALSFGLSACTYAPRVIHLERLPPAAAARSVAPLCIEISPLVDARHEQRLGTARNGFYMQTGEVRTYGEVAQWVREQIAVELTAANASACDSPETPRLTLSGSIDTVFVDEYWNLSGEITLHLTLAHNGTPVWSKPFTARHAQTSYAASESEFTDTLFKTMQNLKVQIVQAVIAHHGSGV